MKVFLRLNGVKCGKGLCLFGVPVIYRYKNARLEIGDNCKIKSSFFSNLIGLYQRTVIIARENAELIIGNNVGMSGVTIYALEKIEIGNNSIIGANVKILDNDFHPVEPTARLKNEKLIGKKEIIIKENVFIGCNSIILKGTVLGNNCVVGAGSVVCGSFSDNSVIAGNPAKVIRRIP